MMSSIRSLELSSICFWLGFWTLRGPFSRLPGRRCTTSPCVLLARFMVEVSL